MDCKKEAATIYSRIDPLFKRMRGHQYKIIVVDSPYVDHYSMFFDDLPNKKTKANARSTPLYEMEKDLDSLNELMAELKKLTNLTVVYRGHEQ